MLLFTLKNSISNFGALADLQKIYTLPNGDRVITMPGYRMPVVVTNMKQFQRMTNLGEDYFVKNFYVPGKPKPTDIPNGALPDKIEEFIKKRK